MKIRQPIVVAILGLSVTAVGLVTETGSDSLRMTEAEQVAPESFSVAAAARIEPASQEVELATSMTGVLREVLVGEGETVRKEQILAVLENSDLEAELARTEAVLRLKEAELRRIENGSRQAERDEAAATVKETEAVLSNAASELERRRAMFLGGSIPREEFEQAQRDYSVATARHAAAVQRYALINDPPRSEDVEIAEAELKAATAARDSAKAMLDKTFVRSPINGTVLIIHRRPGELLSTYAETPIMTVGDISQLNA